MREVISTVYELADVGLTVVPVKSQTGPITSTMGKLLWAINAWDAEMENSEKSEATKAGQAGARADGKHMGGPKAVFNRNEVVRPGMPNTCRGRKSPGASVPGLAPWCGPTMTGRLPPWPSKSLPSQCCKET
jgi:Resolvase, N terminal domain